MSDEVQPITMSSGRAQLPIDAEQTPPTCLSVGPGSSSDERNIVSSLTCIPEESSAEQEM